MAAVPPKLLTPSPVPTSSPAVPAGRVLPKITRNDVLQATKQTFVNPAIAKVTSGFHQLNPVNMAKRWAGANPITATIMDFKSNLNDVRNERDRPNREARAERGTRDDRSGWRNAREGVWNPINRAGGEGSGGNDNSDVVMAIGQLREANVSGFGAITAEMRALRNNVITVVRNTNLQFQETKKLTGGMAKIVTAIEQLNINKGPSLEDRVESNKGQGLEGEVGEKPKSMLASILSMLAGMAINMFTHFKGGVAGLVRTIKNGFGAFGRTVGKLFREIKIPKVLGRLPTMIAELFGKIIKPFEGLMKMLGPITKMGGVVGRLGGLLKVVPVIGEVVIVLMAIFDGIKGFIKGWTETDGNFFQKAWGGLKGAVVQIVKGFIEPFKWLGGLLWKGIKAVGEAFGLGKFFKALEDFNLGAIFHKIATAFNPGNILGKLGDWFFGFIKMLGRKFLPGVAAVIDGAVDAARGGAQAAQHTAASIVETGGHVAGVMGNVADQAGRALTGNTGGASAPRGNKARDMKVLYDEYRRLGLSEEGAHTMVAETNRENSFNPKYMFGAHSDANGGRQNRGIASWNNGANNTPGGRRDELMNWMRSRGMVMPDGTFVNSPESLRAQAQFQVQYEMAKPQYAESLRALQDPNAKYEDIQRVVGKNYYAWDMAGRHHDRDESFSRQNEGYNQSKMLNGGSASPSVNPQSRDADARNEAIRQVGSSVTARSVTAEQLEGLRQVQAMQPAAARTTNNNTVVAPSTVNNISRNTTITPTGTVHYNRGAMDFPLRGW